jgi:hypothetical protein
MLNARTRVTPEFAAENDCRTTINHPGAHRRRAWPGCAPVHGAAERLMIDQLMLPPQADHSVRARSMRSTALTVRQLQAVVNTLSRYSRRTQPTTPGLPPTAPSSPQSARWRAVSVTPEFSFVPAGKSAVTDLAAACLMRAVSDCESGRARSPRMGRDYVAGVRRNAWSCRGPGRGGVRHRGGTPLQPRRSPGRTRSAIRRPVHR